MSKLIAQSTSPATVPAVTPAAAPVVTPAVAPVVTPQVLTRVHKIDTVSERTFWIGHFVFSILAVVGLALIIWARGPRRRDAVLSGSGSEGKE